jgi:anti-anti-sigma factor
VDLQTQHVGGVTVVVATGPLDLGTREPLRRALADLVDSGHVKLVVDLAGVSHIESSGLGTLVEGMKRARAAGGDLRLCSLQDEVRSVLVLTGLLNRMRTYADREAAVAAWR